MKLKKFSYAVAVGVAMCLIQNVSAQDDHWNGTPTSQAWNNPNNWIFNGTTAEVPPSGGAGFIGNVWLDAANGDNVMTITAGDVESPGVPPPGSSEVNNTVFGPEWGTTFNNFGSFSYDWMWAPVQNDPTPGLRTYINLYNNSVTACVGAAGTGGAGLGIGNAWWWYEDAPYVTVNMYGNAQLNEPNIGLGGRLNVYDTAVVNIAGNIFTGNPLTGNYGFPTANLYTPGTTSLTEVNGYTEACNDGTASLNLGGGKLVLPSTFTTNEVTFGGNTAYDLIARGVLRAYGKGQDTNDLIISEGVVTTVGANSFTNAVVQCVPLGGSLQRVYFEPLVQPALQAGDFEQTVLVGDYPSVGGVLLSSSEPGLDPASFTHPVYSSSNPSVVTVDTNGMITAVSPGSSTLTAMVGAFNTTNSIVINVSAAGGTLMHRYSFTSDTSDSVGTANGTLSGDAAISGGQLALSGNVGSSMVLPAGILSNLDEVTIEIWASFPSTINAFANLCAFGTSDTVAFDTFNGDGENYITFCPHTGGSTMQANFGQGTPGFDGERDAVMPGIMDGQTNVQITVVFHPMAGYEAFYTNGVQVATVSMLNNLIDPAAFQGPAYKNHSALAYTLGADPNNYIGQSLYTGDPGLLANVDEVRIYSGALTQAQIAADFALGPNVLPSNAPMLFVSTSGKNLVITWSASGNSGYSLVESTSLGAAASWSNAGLTPTLVGSNYQVTVPMTGTLEFFRLAH